MASSKYVHQFFSLISDGLGGVYVPKLINRWEFDSIIPLGTRYLVLLGKLTKHNFEFETLQQTKQIALNF